MDVLQRVLRPVLRHGVRGAAVRSASGGLWRVGERRPGLVAPRSQPHGNGCAPCLTSFSSPLGSGLTAPAEMRNWMSCRGKGSQRGADRAPPGPVHTLLTTFCCWACFCRRLATSRHSASFSLQQTRRGPAGGRSPGHHSTDGAHPLARPCRC